MRPKRGLTGATLGVPLAVTAIVIVACTAVGYLYSAHHFDGLLESARGSARAEAELIRAALEHEMMDNDRTLVGRMVESFGRQPHIERVLILDRLGAPRHVGGPLGAGGGLEMGSPTCQACHQHPPQQRASTRVIEASGGTVLRTVVPIRNAPACHRCHDPAHGINGVLILDRDVGPLRASMNRDLAAVVGGAGLVTLLLVGAVAGSVRMVIQRRLRRFETAARLIAAGDLARRVPVTGFDTISWLATEFNAMADSVTGLAQELRDQRERLETIINSIDDGIAVLDASRRIIAANDAFLRRLGRGRDEVVGCSCGQGAQALCGVDGCPTQACLETGERQVRVCERRAADGTVRWEEVHTSPLRGAGGAVPCVVEVWRDISERRVAEARLAESHRLASLGLLASGFSHEMNTPLGTVLMCVEGILREAREADGRPAADVLDAVAESAAIARDQVLRCRGVTQNFLRLSRGQPSAGEIVTIGSTVEAAVRLVAPTARAAGVTIDVEPVDPDLRVRADEAELQHVLINLLVNGVQASAAGGRVTASVKAGSPLHICIRDEGCGIAPEKQQQIFEPFFGLRQGGTGLGLFLALNFVRSWGGDIHVESAPGAGSTFDVTLPALAGTESGVIG
jgi:PAS domain S-box-containing protein